MPTGGVIYQARQKVTRRILSVQLSNNVKLLNYLYTIHGYTSYRAGENRLLRDLYILYILLQCIYYKCIYDRKQENANLKDNYVHITFILYYRQMSYIFLLLKPMKKSL